VKNLAFCWFENIRICPTAAARATVHVVSKADSYQRKLKKINYNRCNILKKYGNSALAEKFPGKGQPRPKNTTKNTPSILSVAA